MRLLNTTTLKLREPSSEKVPYAILSHCWEDEEVLFQDIQGPDPSAKKGFKKLANCCARAKSRGYEWVWIDTCCIDKTSSSELSEAINSMYRWYAESDICYAFLSDFSSSRWFTRGWTLQELLAPRKVEFYNSHWQFVGTKASLVEQLVFITRIDEQSLLGCGSILDVPVARKLSWAASRETTRVEDIAYCLMGLFGVNMPLLYGEGKKAFMRLQGEIIQQTNDHTILLLSNRPPDSIRYKGLPSILEYSPAEWRKCGI
ncbi:HET-domain-containing protein [Xylariaceae sp. FL0016]|nr:HET-domain-containing protein [Xylariaceae sp. FL0016]